MTGPAPLKPPSAVVDGFPRSGIRELIDLAIATPGILRLEVGEPDFLTAAHIIEAAHRDAADGYTKYSPTAGYMSLRQAIAARATRRWGRTVPPECVFVAAGGLGAVTAAVLAVADAGDEVLIPDPHWPNLLGLVTLARLQPVAYRLGADREFLPDVDEVRDGISDRTKAMYINNPGNPTGAVFPPEHVERLAEVAAATGTYLVSDEVYDELVYEGEHTPAALFDAGHVITVGSFSKTYAMTGWRVGYAVAPPAIVAACEKVSEAYSLMASSISQRAAEAALTGSQECVTRLRNAVRSRRDLVVRLFEHSGMLAAVPRGAFYALLDLRELRAPSRDLARDLVAEERVAVAPGSTFGRACEGMLRISLASSEADIAEAAKRILAFVERRRVEQAAAARSPGAETHA